MSFNIIILRDLQKKVFLFLGQYRTNIRKTPLFFVQMGDFRVEGLCKGHFFVL